MLMFEFLWTLLGLQSVAAFTFAERPTWQTLFGPRIPTFMLDLKHPWIQNNTATLRKLSDAGGELCDPNSLQRSSGLKLFQYLEIDNNKYGVDRPGWINARARLQEILACPAALQEIESFRIDIWAQSKPPKDLASLFVEALYSMPILRRLEWHTSSSDTKFEHDFLNMRLQSVKEVRVHIDAVFLIQTCPAIEDIYITRKYDHRPADVFMKAINSTRGLTDLTTFGMDDWELQYLEALHLVQPRLETIHMDGSMVPHWRSDEYSVKDFLQILKRFEALRTLRLPPSFELGLGFDGGPWCGNAYMGPGGRAYRRQVVQKSCETAERAARMTLEALPELEFLKVGGSEVIISRNGNGTALTWPWTEVGLQNWTYSLYPDLENQGEDEF